MVGFLVLYAVIALERLAELLISRRNAAWSYSQGGQEFGREHYPWMVLLHTGTLLLAPLEVFWLNRPFTPLSGYACLALCAVSQALRWWVISTLGRRWNTRVIVIPSLVPIEGGPFRWFRHPNYLAVVVEGAALPLVHNAWITATLFTLLNLWLLSVRIAVEDRALGRRP